MMQTPIRITGQKRCRLVQHPIGVHQFAPAPHLLLSLTYWGMKDSQPIHVMTTQKLLHPPMRCRSFLGHKGESHD